MGMIKATRRHYFANTVIGHESQKILLYGKYPQYGITPFIIQEAPWAVIAIIAIAIITQVLKFLNHFGFDVARVLKIARETKSAIMIFSVVPIIVHGVHNLYSISFSKLHTFWSVLNIVAFTVISVMYVVKATKVFLAIADIKYLHGRSCYITGKTEVEQGLDIIVDCYVHKGTNVAVRVVEYVFLLFLAYQYTSPYPFSLAPAIVSVFFYFFLMCLNIHLYITSKVGTRERILQRRIIWLNVSFHFLMCTVNIVYCLLGGLNEVNLTGVFSLSAIWFIQLALLGLTLLL